jgi:hypothetical protein
MLRYLLIIAISLTASGCSIVRGTKTLAPDFFGFVEISNEIYVDRSMPISQRTDFLKTVKAAQERVSQFFGDLDGHPKIFACSTEACFVSNRFGFTPKGQAYGSSALILSPRGLDVVIISHELTHIELHTRVGAIRSWHSIPDWFDEGLAVLVSQDPRYSEAAWNQATENKKNVPPLNALDWGKGGWMKGYGTARHAVGDWYVHAGRDGLLRLIALIKNGSAFDTALTKSNGTSNHL